MKLLSFESIQEEINRQADEYYEKRPEGFGDPREDFMAGFTAALTMLLEAESSEAH